MWPAFGFSLLEGTVAIALTIVAVIVLNAALSLAQELHAEEATEALPAYLPRHPRVRPDGDVTEVGASQLAPDTNVEDHGAS